MRWIPAALYALLIVVLSSVPSQSFPPSELFGYDKILHLVEFFALGALVMWAWRRTWPTLFFCTVFAVLDEVHQSFTPGRDASAWDALADGVGLALGVGLCWLLLRRLQATGATGATGAIDSR